MVSSNEPDFVSKTVQEAIRVYGQKAGAGAVAPALDVLTRLKGIGPATASLLLAVHDPERVIFFGDEVFYWLCCDGKKDAIKYNAKEYRELTERAAGVAKRLGVAAVDIERVAFVVMREQDEGGISAPLGADANPGSKLEQTAKSKPILVSKDTEQEFHKSAKAIKRRAEPSEVINSKQPVRRSKRGKRT